MSALDAFREALTQRGLAPPAEILPDGKLHRCNAATKNGMNDGAYIFHLDGRPAGGFQNWQDGAGWETWSYANGHAPPTPAEREAMRARAEQDRAEREQGYAKAAHTAAEIWAASKPGPHPYLEAKEIAAFGARVHGDKLVVPIRNSAKVLRSLQFIAADGSKRYLPGGEKQGGYFVIGKPADVICIGEGFATMASIHEATGYACVVAFDCGNLDPVAKTIREKFPSIAIVVCADDDHLTPGNPGVSKASAAARAIGGKLAVPVFSGDRQDHQTDFNDMRSKEGLPAVKAAIDAAASGDVVEQEPDPDDKPSANPVAAEIAGLAALSALEYDRIRKDKAKELGVKVGTLDAEVKKRRPADARGHDALPTIEPWPYPVDGERLLEDLSQAITRHAGLPKGPEDQPAGAYLVALWIMHTHAIDAANITPLLAITSPTQECGKSTVLKLVTRLSPLPLLASNISPAAVFRSIEKWQPTLIIDEADTFLKDNDELRGVLNSGHSRDTAFVVRTVGDDHDPRKFSTWAAKTIAMIGSLPPTLASRSIHIEMRRLGEGEKVEPLDSENDGYLKPLAQQAVRWTQDHLEELRKLKPRMPQGFINRRADNWRPLLVIADLVGGEWPERARLAATTFDRADSGQTTGLLLLADIRDLFADRGWPDRFGSQEIADYLAELEGKPWPDFRNGKPISTNQLARLLKPFKIFSSNIRTASGTPKGYMLADFEENFARYLSPLQTATTPQCR